MKYYFSYRRQTQICRNPHLLARCSALIPPAAIASPCRFLSALMLWGAFAAQLASAQTVSPPSGNELIAASARELDQAKSLAARIRQTGEILGHPLEAQGSYLQADQEGEKLFRLELQMSVGKTRSSLLQVCNLDSLCFRRDLGGKVKLTRVLLSEVREAELKAQSEGQPRFDSLFTRGGLPQMMKSLDSNFRFSAPQQGVILSTPVWVTEGHWRKKPLTRLLPDQKDAINAGQEVDYSMLPPQAPGRIQVVLGREGMGRLIPFRIVYFRAAKKPPEGESPLLKIEFLEVRRDAQIDPAYFAYNPDDPEVIDVTEQYLQRRQKQKKE